MSLRCNYHLLFIFVALSESLYVSAKVECEYTTLKKIICHFDSKKEEFSISAFKKNKRIPANLKKKITSLYYQKNQIPSEK